MFSAENIMVQLCYCRINYYLPDNASARTKIHQACGFERRNNNSSQTGSWELSSCWNSWAVSHQDLTDSCRNHWLLFIRTILSMSVGVFYSGLEAKTILSTVQLFSVALHDYYIYCTAVIFTTTISELSHFCWLCSYGLCPSTFLTRRQNFPPKRRKPYTRLCGFTTRGPKSKPSSPRKLQILNVHSFSFSVPSSHLLSFLFFFSLFVSRNLCCLVHLHVRVLFGFSILHVGRRIRSETALKNDFHLLPAKP